MRELTVRIRFTTHCLGDAPEPRSGKRRGAFLLPRSPDDKVIFMATWHQSNMRFAAKTLGKHQDAVRLIHWDVTVDAAQTQWFKRYFRVQGGSKQRYCLHEAFFPGQIIGINCVVPSVISEDDFWSLLRIAGQYKGLSPWKPGEFGFFDVESIVRRRPQAEDQDVNETGNEVVETRRLKKEEAR